MIGQRSLIVNELITHVNSKIGFDLANKTGGR